MPHHVYANGREICAKSADGSSDMAVDVCHSPGAPMPGIPVPYMNSCKASDLANGSRTVFIKGMEVCLEDQSYFAKSYGDEAATQGLKKGAVSGSVQGKCRFVSWSPNVFVEGRAVTRHLDLVTHNHNSPSNTGPVPYRSVFEKAAPCEGDRRAIANDCPEKKPGKDKKRKGLVDKLAKVAAIPDEAAQKALAYRRSPGRNAWVEDHCSGLWIKPMSGTEQFESAKAQIEQFLNQDKLSLAKQACGELLALAKDQLGIGYVFRKAGGLAARSLLKNAVGGLAGATGVGLVVTAGMATWTVADVLATAATVAKDLGPRGAEILAELTSLDNIEKGLREKMQQWREQPSRAMADMMTVDATLDACIRARKCMLVPYDKTDSLEAAQSGAGCCPGQTGHHVIPGSMMGRKSGGSTDPTISGCKGEYNHENAPTMCLEGANNTHGSHGLAHSLLRKRIDAYKEKQRQAGPQGNPSRITYQDAREASLAAVKDVAPWCDIQCLRAQLDSYYKHCDKGNEKNLKPSYGGGRKLPAPREIDDADW